MRPAGEVRQALLQAAGDLVYVEDGRPRGPTLQELAARAQVGAKAALTTVKNMTRSGALRPIGERKVPYRNRPVAEYAPALELEGCAEGPGFVDLGRLLAVWAR
jgi:hypothetical protein